MQISKLGENSDPAAGPPPGEERALETPGGEADKVQEDLHHLTAEEDHAAVLKNFGLSFRLFKDLQ